MLVLCLQSLWAVSGVILYLRILGCYSDCMVGQHDELQGLNGFYNGMACLKEVMLSWRTLVFVSALSRPHWTFFIFSQIMHNVDADMFSCRHKHTKVTKGGFEACPASKPQCLKEYSTCVMISS